MNLNKVSLSHLGKGDAGRNDQPVSWFQTKLAHGSGRLLQHFVGFGEVGYQHTIYAPYQRQPALGTG